MEYLRLITAVMIIIGGVGLLFVRMHGLQAAAEPPWGYHMTDTDRAVLWAIPFKRYGADDAMYGRVTEADLVAEEAEIAKLRKWRYHVATSTTR